MSKTTQENPAVENSATETVSKPSTRSKRSTKNPDTANATEKSPAKTTRTRSTSARTKKRLQANKIQHL